MRTALGVWGAALVWGLGTARAGMPPPPPLLEYAKPAPKEEPSSASASTVRPTEPSDSAEPDDSVMRLRVVSFFAAAFVVCAAGVRFLWNSLRRDAPQLPRLTFPRALSATALWGLLFVLVLTMISGARELMTPGAWVRNGLTYKLADPAPAPAPAPVATASAPSDGDRFALAVRRKALKDLGDELWKDPNNSFPATQFERDYDFSGRSWFLPDGSGVRYVYISGLSKDGRPQPLAYEPAIVGDQRLVLLTNREIVTMTTAEIQAAVRRGAQ